MLIKQVPNFTQALTINGDAAGFVTVSDSSRFMVGAHCYIYSSAETSIEVVIVRKDGNKVYLRRADMEGKIYVSDMSAFHLADSAVLVQNCQLVTPGLDLVEFASPDPAETRNGAVQVNVAATLIKAANPSRRAIIIQNLGPNDIYIGPDATVTSATGLLVAKSGGSVTLISTNAVYGICTVLQATPADTRYSEDLL